MVVFARVFLSWLLCLFAAGFLHPLLQRKANGATDLMSLRPLKCLSAPPRRKSLVKQVTSAVETITGEQMQQRKIKTVVEALRLAQGLAVFQSGGPGTLAQVRMRGGTPQQTLVLIDGAIVNSATDGTYTFANLTTDNIDRIEILRGSQGMMWGSDAMGGVVNIITKRGRETPNVSSFVEYGSFATIREGASATGKKGPVDVAATLSRWDTSNFSPSIIGEAPQSATAFTTGRARSNSAWICRRTAAWSLPRWMDGITNLDGTTFNPVTSDFDPADVEPRLTTNSMCIPAAICSRSRIGGRND